MQMDKKGQEMFLSFILQRVKEDKVEEAKELLAENFKKQDENTFTREDIEQFIPKMMNLLNPDKNEEIKAVTKQFSGIFSKNKVVTNLDIFQVFFLEGIRKDFTFNLPKDRCTIPCLSISYDPCLT